MSRTAMMVVVVGGSGSCELVMVIVENGVAEK